MMNKNAFPISSYDHISATGIVGETCDCVQMINECILRPEKTLPEGIKQEQSFMQGADPVNTPDILKNISVHHFILLP